MAGGGAAVQPDLVDKIDKALDNGVPATGYGLTETHGIVTANSARLYLAKPESCRPDRADARRQAGRRRRQRSACRARCRSASCACAARS